MRRIPHDFVTATTKNLELRDEIKWKRATSIRTRIATLVPRKAPSGRSGAIDEGDLGVKPIAVKDSAAREELIDLWRWERPLSLM